MPMNLPTLLSLHTEYTIIHTHTHTNKNTTYLPLLHFAKLFSDTQICKCTATTKETNSRICKIYKEGKYQVHFQRCVYVGCCASYSLPLFLYSSDPFLAPFCLSV